MARAFLDANVLWSASYKADSGLRRPWDLEDVTLLTSTYALEEARRNSSDDSHRARLEELVRGIEVFDDPPLDPSLKALADLPANDRPILQGAVTSGASHLLTGDRKAFGPLFGASVRGVEVVRPATFFPASPVID